MDCLSQKSKKEILLLFYDPSTLKWLNSFGMNFASIKLIN